MYPEMLNCTAHQQANCSNESVSPPASHSALYLSIGPVKVRCVVKVLPSFPSGQLLYEFALMLLLLLLFSMSMCSGF